MAITPEGSRRAFLSSLIGAGVAAAVDPEKLLWEPGKKLISIPARRVTIADIREAEKIMAAVLLNGEFYHIKIPREVIYGFHGW